jgi:hydrogenase maturation protein HypF
MNSLESKLRICDPDRTKLIVADGIFSMEGDILKLPEVVKLAERYNATNVPVQHHHAHLSSLMVDHGLRKNENITFIAIDGVGYGEDGMAWGGEILVGGYEKYERVAQLKYQPMPGGDLCSYYPIRMLASMLSSFMDDTDIITLFKTKYVKHLAYKNEE